jgi:hypothetical protein
VKWGNRKIVKWEEKEKQLALPIFPFVHFAILLNYKGGNDGKRSL